MRNTKKDYYKTLGVNKNSSEQEIKRAYRKLALQFHPDKNPGNEKIVEEKFKKIAEAYSVLGRSETKKMYDLHGSPNSSVEEAVRKAWDSYHNNPKNQKDWESFYSNFAENVHSQWEPEYESAWGAALHEEVQGMRNFGQKYFNYFAWTIISATGLGFAHGYFNGLDVAPFNWVWPENELESYRATALSNSDTAKNISGYFGALTMFLPTMAITGLTLWYNSISNAIRGYTNFNNKNKKTGIEKIFC